MKLTDIMFNLDFIAAQTGAEVACGGEVFEYTSGTTNASSKVTLEDAPVALTTGGTAYLWYRKADEGGKDMEKIAATTAGQKEFTLPAANTEYCLMYRKTVDAGKKLTVSSQFIPDTVHAVLTVALYSGDSCDVEAATKAGEITIDIPRLQLTGAMDLSMTATGSCQTPMEGNALASGCTGCDGKAVYATITQYISGKKWYENFKELTLSGIPTTITKSQSVNFTIVPYATGGTMQAKQITYSTEYPTTFAVAGTGVGTIAVSSTEASFGVVSGSAGTTGEITFTAVTKDGTTTVLEGAVTKTLA